MRPCRPSADAREQAGRPKTLAWVRFCAVSSTRRHGSCVGLKAPTALVTGEAELADTFNHFGAAGLRQRRQHALPRQRQDLGVRKVYAMKHVRLTIALVSVCGLGACGKTNAPSAGESNAASGDSAARDAAVARGNAALKDAAKQQAAQAAQAGQAAGACSDVAKTFTDKIQAIITSLQSGSDVSQASDQMTAAIDEMSKCISQQAGAGAGAGGGAGGVSCSVKTVNGKTEMVGDCSKCQVQDDGKGSVSVSCNSVGGNAGAIPTLPASPNIDLPVAPDFPVPGPNDCAANVVNGQLVKTGDCSNCTVKQQGTNVSINCVGQ